MAELMTAVNELLKGKRVEENADIYCDGIETLYKSSAYVKLCMNYHIFSEVYEEIDDDEKKVIQPVVARIQTLVSNLVERNDIDADLMGEAESIRERLVNVMEILTAHADRLQIFEYMLNRIEFRFRNEPFDSTYYNDGFERDIERYVLSDRDNAVINMKITQMVSQLPMRLSQNRFFNIIENSLSIYKGSERSSLDDFVYMIKTAGTLFGRLILKMSLMRFFRLRRNFPDLTMIRLIKPDMRKQEWLMIRYLFLRKDIRMRALCLHR